MQEAGSRKSIDHRRGEEGKRVLYFPTHRFPTKTSRGGMMGASEGLFICRPINSLEPCVPSDHQKNRRRNLTSIRI